ncbi:MAG: di-heme oxidoredictase family protein [Planctomycetota bacterium]|jgi:CxxC motif-containing protein (DUF1111 family)
MRRHYTAALILLGGLALGGIVPPDSPLPLPGQAGAPFRALSPEEEARFLRGRQLFDKDFLSGDGVGPHFNGDSCRACHLDPVIAGAGGIDVQVQRPVMDDGSSPPETGALAQTHARPGLRREEIPLTVAFVEERNSPSLLGLGLVQTISEAAIRANQDPQDGDGDGILGVAHVLPDGSVGRLGWKADFPDLRSFVRDAMSSEMGITVPPDPGNAFGETSDGDGVQDPELDPADLDDIVFFLELLAFPPRRPATTQSQEGETLFTSLGCVKCHVPVLDGVECYSNLLLHDVHPPGFEGVAQGMATSGLYRTAPLRGLRDTAPYFHNGRSETVDDAIRRHDGEALAIRQAYENLTQAEREALLAFLLSL